MSHDSRTILITGVTRGIGRALAERFASDETADHVVLGCGRTEREIASLAGDHSKPHGFAVVDVADAAAVEAWAAELLADEVVPDLIINNAALMNELAPLWSVPAGEFDRMLAVNIGGVANVVRAFVPSMVERACGVIVNLSSGWGRSTSPEVAPYCATKYAIEGLTGSLAQELPAPLAAVALSPGVVDTAMLRECLPDLAPSCVGPKAWAARHAAGLLAIGRAENGRSMSME